MDRLKLSISNLLYILFKSDLLALRFVLCVGSIMWATWALVTAFFLLPSFGVYQTIFGGFPFEVWPMMFAIHGTVGVTCLLLKQTHRPMIVMGSMFGAALWTASLNMVVVARLAESTLPMGGAHWIAAIIAWWIFIRDCYGN